MKIFLMSLGFIIMALPALAQEEAQHITYVDGSGQYSAYCTANDFFCSRNVQQNAERDATQNAETRCEIDRGTPLTYTATCNTMCNPIYIPPNTNTWVSCNSNCRIQCDIKD